jgi:hypothetical protein
MRQPIAFLALMLPLAACVVEPAPPMARPIPAPEFVYPGYAYNNGAPTLFVDGVSWPLIWYGGGWGYWDHYHRWHRAPDPVWRHLEGRYPGGAGFHYGRPVGFGGHREGMAHGYGPRGRPGPGYDHGGYRHGGWRAADRGGGSPHRGHDDRDRHH